MEKKADAAVGFDLVNLDVVAAANDGAEFSLLHPTSGDDLGIKIRVIGMDSDEFRRFSNAQARRRVAKMSKGGFRNKPQDVEEIEAESIELLAHATKGWTGMVMNGKEVPFTKDAAVDIYTKYPWIREQVNAAIGDRALFIKA